ncbi:hypothetical protein [Mycolicibacterium hippocampi]|uniref:hypothetical protein n=1 Tax=Mycolicibacterium hippocampi TaxID=659824 RepID=UPI00351905FF
MGRGFARLRARQHPDLTATSTPASGRLRLAMLVLIGADGVFSALMAVFFLPLRIGPVPLPVSALLSGVLNALLVWAALQWTPSPRLAALPLWTWLLTVLVFTFGGPGDDIVFGGTGIMEFAPLLLIALGALPGAWVLVRHSAPAG